MTINLKPCPLCGTEVSNLVFMGPQGYRSQIDCQNCGCSYQTRFYRSRDDAINEMLKEWNHREPTGQNVLVSKEGP